MRENKVFIFKPPKSSMQSASTNSKKWCLSSCEINETYINSRYCWTGTFNSEKKIKLYFNGLEAAISFAKKNNYIYEVLQPNIRKIIKKSYAKNFIRK